MPHDAIPVIEQFETDEPVAAAEPVVSLADRAERAPSHRAERGPQERGPQERGGRDRRDDRRRGDGNRATEERGEQPSSGRNERFENRTEQRPDQRSEPRVEQSRTEQPRSEQPRSEQRNYRSSYPGQYDRIVGMGDHVPDFILRSFRLREVTPDDDETEATTAA